MNITCAAQFLRALLRKAIEKTPPQLLLAFDRTVDIILAVLVLDVVVPLLLFISPGLWDLAGSIPSIYPFSVVS